MDTKSSSENNIPSSSSPSFWQKFSLPIMVILLLIGLVGGYYYWQEQQKYVYTDKASVSVPVISLTAHSQGKLKKILVKNGDLVVANQTIALVGTETIKTDIDGQILTINEDIGHEYRTGETIATMINPQEMKIVALLEENKGLNQVRLGQQVTFTVDAYGSKKFTGVVHNISQTSHEGDVVFNISDKREEKEFAIDITYDHAVNPQFQNGMSAKVWIIK